MTILSMSNYDLVVGALCLIAIAFAASTIYSVYFGPLSKCPGPKLAAATLLYEFYYDVILKGQYTYKIRELHQQYGLLTSLSPVSPDPKYPNQHYPQGPLSASVPTNSTSMNQIIMMSCTPFQNHATNINGSSPHSASQTLRSRPSTTSTTVSGARP